MPPEAVRSEARRREREIDAEPFSNIVQALESEVLDGLGATIAQLARAVDAVTRRDVELARVVVAADE